MSTLKVDTILKRTGTGTITLGQSGDTIAIPSGATISNSGTATGFGQDNSPCFHAYANQSYIAIANDTYTTLACPNEAFDTGSAYNTSTYRFTPQTAGKYFFYANAVWDGSGNFKADVLLQKNGSFDQPNFFRNSNYATNTSGSHVSGIISMNGSSDYVSAVVYHQYGSSVNLRNQGNENFFGGFLVTTT